MEGALPVLIGVAVVGLIIAAAVWSRHYERKRIEALTAWARSAGWTFSTQQRSAPPFPDEVFQRGHSRWSRHHARQNFPEATPGLDGAALDLFEYHYAITRTTGKTTTTTHYYLTCALADAGLDLGSVEIRHEGLFDKIAGALGPDDIDFEDPEFSKRFHVQAAEHQQAWDLIDGALMRWLVRHQGVAIATHGRRALFLIDESVDVETYERIAGFALGFLAELPRTLVNAERAQRGLPPIIEAGNAAAAARRLNTP